MKRPLWVLAGLLALAAATGLVLAGRRLEAAGSTLSRGAGGWLAARAYLEQAGVATHLLDGPLGEAPPGSTLALVFPWQSRRSDLDLDAVREHLAGGGALVVAYAGEMAPAPAEVTLLDALGAPVQAVGTPPVAPWRWRAARRDWTLRPAARWRSASADLELRRPRWLPRPPAGSGLLEGPDGQPVAAAWAHGGGRVLVLPAELLCNARLGAPAHAALLETLRRGLPPVWAFDELHHGLAGVGTPLPAATRRGFDMLFGQLALLYAVGALALARRFGPAWREAPQLVGSAATFLLRLGRLHHRLGHHRQGAELLLRRAAELDRRFVAGPELSVLAARGDAGALVELAQRLAQRDGERRRPEAGREERER